MSEGKQYEKGKTLAQTLLHCLLTTSGKELSLRKLLQCQGKKEVTDEQCGSRGTISSAFQCPFPRTNEERKDLNTKNNCAPERSIAIQSKLVLGQSWGKKPSETTGSTTQFIKREPRRRGTPCDLLWLCVCYQCNCEQTEPLIIHIEVNNLNW